MKFEINRYFENGKETWERNMTFSEGVEKVLMYSLNCDCNMIDSRTGEVVFSKSHGNYYIATELKVYLIQCVGGNN